MTVPLTGSGWLRHRVELAAERQIDLRADARRIADFGRRSIADAGDDRIRHVARDQPCEENRHIARAARRRVVAAVADDHRDFRRCQRPADALVNRSRLHAKGELVARIPVALRDLGGFARAWRRRPSR